MRIRILALGLLLLLSTGVLIWTKQVKTDPPPKLEVTAIGLDDLNIRVEAPYGSRSVNHALIINDSPHHVLACELLFEFITKAGEIHTTQGVVAYANLLTAERADAREKLFKSQLGIAPGSKMLFGMGADPKLLPASGELPPLATDVRTVEAEKMNRAIFEKLVIKLNAVVIEDGKAFGPGADKFLAHLDQLIKEVKQ